MRVIAALGLVVLLVAGACAGGGERPEFVQVPGLGATRVDVPRPTTPGAASCTPALRTGEAVSARAAALRGIGLFTDRRSLSDAELGTAIDRGIAATWGDQVGSKDPLLELYVAEQDHTRVWWRDLEADVGNGADVYKTTLDEWAAISVGAFTPTSVEETWASDTGPVTVTFKMAGVDHELRPEYIEDWIDPRIATDINRLIAGTNRQFLFFRAFDQTAFAMALTPEERQALEARGWCFE